MTESNSCVHSTLVELCQDAVAHCGGDWRQIQAYLAERLACMPGGDREKLRTEIERILGFRAPSRPSVLH